MAATAYLVHMWTVVIRSGMLLAGVSGLAVSTAAVQDQLEAYRQKLQQAPAATEAGTALGAAVAQWQQLQQSNGLGFDSYAGFLLAHPGWPGEAVLRRAAERALDTSSWSPGVAASYFRRFAPLTGTGMARNAQALASVGLVNDANGAARAAWTQGTLPASDEMMILAQFGAALTPADHDARMDALLWAGAVSAAQRQIALVGPARRALFEARLAFRSKSADATALASATELTFAGDAGYVADRATWLRTSGNPSAARAWLARPHALTTRPADIDGWYQVLLTNARGAAADGQHDLAFNIARQVDDAYPEGTDISARPWAERNAYTDLVWLAGQTAMKALNRPAEAIGLFARYAGGAQGAGLRAKGYYWAGRAALAAGRGDEAAQWLNRAAAYRDQFYGQVATEKLGRALVPPPEMAARSIDPQAREAFYSSEVVRAARYLGTVGDHGSQTAFIRQIALNATTDSDHALATELSRALGRPDLGVLIARSALQNGLTDYVATGYPSVAVPEGAADAWTIVHAISRQESQFDRAAVSRAGARGLMQLLPSTAREQAGKLGVAFDSAALTGDPQYNIQLGSAYFQRLYATYSSYPLAIAAYNAGGGNVNKWLRANGDPRTGAIDMIDWIEAIPFSETRAYVQHVVENAVVYDLLNPNKARSAEGARISWYLGRTTPAG